MPDYKRMYLRMAACMADIADMAIAAQNEVEEIYYQTSGSPLPFDVWVKEQGCEKKDIKEDEE